MHQPITKQLGDITQIQRNSDFVLQKNGWDTTRTGTF